MTKKKKVLLLSLICALLAVFSFQTAMAYNPSWKADQAKMLEQLGLKPGDVINRSNAEKVKGYVPDSVLSWIKKGEFVLTIGEMKYDYSQDESWDKASMLNVGKYGLGSNKEVIDNATGSFPRSIYGNPFPDLDLTKDPEAGIKYMHNKKVVECRPSTLDQFSSTNWVGEGGYERDFLLRWRRWYAWARPEGEVENPTDTKSFELTQLLMPYDLTGTVILTDSPLNGQGDKQYVYVPSIRRVKKQSGAARSDPSFGSDFVSDDGAGWAGQAESMAWKIIGEKVALVPVEGWLSEHPDVYVKQPDGSWKTKRNIPDITPLFGYNDPNAPAGVIPWCPTSVVWVPRKVILLEATPLDPYYNYGKQVFWFDKENYGSWYKIIQNKAGEYWKTLIVNVIAQDWGDAKFRTYGFYSFYVIVDDKSHHSSIAYPRADIGHDVYSDHIVNGPGVKLEYMRPEYIPLLSK